MAVEGCFGEFGVVLFEAVGDSEHELVLDVVGSGIVPHLGDIEMELCWLFVDIVVEFELDGLDIDGIGDDAVIVGSAVSGFINWF